MKLSFKTILPIILISALLILLAGCFGIPTDESPGYTPGTITGIIAAPCCSTSDDPVTETCCVSPEYWCYYCQGNWLLQDGIEVVLTYGEDEVATTTTNDKGEFTFTNVDPGKNYVVTAYCPDFADNRPLVKDVALQLVEGGSFDTNITDLVSTSLGLVVDFLVLYTDWGPEDISLDAVLADRPTFPNFPKFKALIYEVRRVVENCEINLLTDDQVQYATCRAAEEISGLEIGCGAGYTSVPPPPEPPAGKYNLYLIADPWDGAKTLTGEGVYNEGTQNVAVDTEANSCYIFQNWTVDLGNLTWVTGGLNTEPLEVDMFGNVTLTAHFACPDVDSNLIIDIGEVSKARTLNASGLRTVEPVEPDASICLPNCAIINSVTVNCDCTEGSAFPLVLVPPYDASVLTFAYDLANISFDYGSGIICYVGTGTLPYIATIVVTYTNPCGVAAATGTVTVEFKDCSCIAPTVVADGPYTKTVCPGTAATIDFDSTVTLGTGPFTYAWTFGDGGTSTEADPSHTYPAGAGVYNVTLVVTNDCGNPTYETTVTITESAAVTANAGPDQSEVVCPCADALINLVGSGTGTGLSYAWDLDGDGLFDNSTAQNPQDVPFGATGSPHTVSLQVTGDCGSAIDEMIVTITECINHAPVIASIPSQSVINGHTYTYDVNATDEDGDTLTYTLTTWPDGMQINRTTGVITWSPAYCPSRCWTCPVDVTVKVTDDGCCGTEYSTKSFTVVVRED